MKRLLVITGIITAVVCCFARLSVFGWLYFIGLLTVLIFGIIHTFFIIQISRQYNKIGNVGRLSAAAGIILFAFIFLFQFDGGDVGGIIYTYEVFTGNSESAFEDIAYLIGIYSALAYIINFIIWRITVRRARKQRQLTPAAGQ